MVHTKVDDIVKFFVEISNVLNVRGLGIASPLGSFLLNLHWLNNTSNNLWLLNLFNNSLLLVLLRRLINQILSFAEKLLMFLLEVFKFLEGIIANLLELSLILLIDSLLNALPFILRKV